MLDWRRTPKSVFEKLSMEKDTIVPDGVFTTSPAGGNTNL